MKVILCDNCRRKFIPFELDKGANGYGYGFAVPTYDLDPVFLFPEGDTAFLCFTEPEPERQDEYQYWCVRCIESLEDSFSS